MAVHGKGTYMSLDNSSGTPVNISTWLKKVDSPFAIDKHDSTTFGANSKTYDVGLKDGTISIDGIWSATVESHFTALLGLAATSTFAIGPDTNTSGKPRRTGECRLISYKPPGSVSDLNMFTAELQITGDVTFDTF